jgi:hypothetical protein
MSSSELQLILDELTWAMREETAAIEYEQGSDDWFMCRRCQSIAMHRVGSLLGRNGIKYTLINGSLTVL